MPVWGEMVSGWRHGMTEDKEMCPVCLERERLGPCESAPILAKVHQEKCAHQRKGPGDS